MENSSKQDESQRCLMVRGGDQPVNAAGPPDKLGRS
jgi:hypothetical protein